MKSPNSRTGRSAKTGHFLLGSSRGAKISEVEDLKVSARMGRILTESASRGLLGDERRTLIKEQIRKK
ncbi:hypothetical protein [Mesorhizobium sp. ES1-1]|uniref:hypothetical protein n=1 Tax=Mesorhizobium sp. ES1-1 TaxID=2876629 RepID=UPI001CCDDD35|nr:hypothetical protein [Mesorhizobium sp. ES1-1]MBZ9676339.1 hypothetical protein [Mesorhizobium sp. ES1-1]